MSSIDTTFISYLLTFCLAVILVVYLYQITDGSRINTNLNKNNKVNSNSFSLMINKLNKIIISIIKKIVCQFIMLVQFAIFTNLLDKYKICQMLDYQQVFQRWDGVIIFLTNYSTPHTQTEDPFSGIPTRYFLDNMESVDNLYRKC